ncbi:DUF2637 domain-containing protein [Streptomyces nigrescens]
MTHSATYPPPTTVPPPTTEPSRTPAAPPSAPAGRAGAPDAPGAREDAAMNYAMTGGQTSATGEAVAPAAPGTAGATPPGHPATPATSEDAPAKGRLGGQRSADAATTPLPTAPATTTPAPATVATGPATPAWQRVPRWFTLTLIAGAVLAMVLVVSIGFASSYDTLKIAAVHKGFAPWLARWVPIGVDGGILGFLAFDLVMLARGISWPVLRFAAHGLTLATVVLNAAAGGRPITADPVRAFWHGLMPILFIVGVEAGRKLLLHAAQLAAGTDRDSIPLHRWVLSPLETPRLYRRMRLANVRSYKEMVKRELDLKGYRVWLKQQHGGSLKTASEIEMLPMTMAPRGYTVEKALALPEKWAAEQAERERQAAERKQLEAERQAEDAKRARIRAIRDRGEIQQTEHLVEAETSTAQSQAEKTRAEAEAEAEAARIRAEHTRRQAERIATTETEALESADAAAARRKAATDEEEAAKAAHRAQAERRKAEAEKLQADRLAADRKAEANRRAAEEKKAAEDLEAAEASRRRAQEHRKAAAEAEAAALEAEDLIRLTSRERKARRVARMILAAGAVDAVPLTDIEAELSVARTTAGELRQEAADLLTAGYRP